MPVLLILALLAALPPAPAAGTGPPAAPPAPAPAPAAGAPDPSPALAWRLAEVAVVVPRGDGRGQVLEPSGLAVDPFGRLAVADAALHRLQRFEADGRWLGEVGSLGSDPGQLRRPGSLAMLGPLTVAALDVENRRIEHYDLFSRRLGTLVDLLEPSLAARLGRVDPLALASDRGGALYLADADRDRVLAFDFAGRYLRTIGGFGGRAGSFRGLSGLATAPRGELVTTERAGARVQRLDAGGRVGASWPIAVPAGPGALPVAVDDSSRVAVADEVSGLLWLFDPAGTPLAMLRDLARPRALAFAPDGTLLVAEAGRGTVRRFVLERGEPPAVEE